MHSSTPRSSMQATCHHGCTAAAMLADSFCPPSFPAGRARPPPFFAAPHPIHPPAAPIPAGALEAWPSRTKWDERYLCEHAGELDVTVDVTPTGRGDAVTTISAAEVVTGGGP
eukprot:52853-Chlamydomonas_euryale.AAC.14